MNPSQVVVIVASKVPYRVLMQAKLYSTSMLADHVFFAEASIFLASVATGDSASAHTYFEAAMYGYSTNVELQNRCQVTLANWDAPCALAMLMMVQGSGDYTSGFAIQLVREFADAHIGGVGDITYDPNHCYVKLWLFFEYSKDGATIHNCDTGVLQ